MDDEFYFLDADDLRDDEIYLKLDKTVLGDPEKGWVPAYFFDICLLDGTDVGDINLRIGYNEKTYIGGNIGYRIEEPFRGNHYAAKACKLLFELAAKHEMNRLIVTCDPINIASARTIEKIGGEFLEIAEIPEDNEMYAQGKRFVRIYRIGLEKNKKLITKKSVGGVVYTIVNNEIKYLIIQQTDGLLGFPKGHVEKGETEQKTAVREIFEETGVCVSLDEDFRKTETYYMPKYDKQKLVVYFLAKALNVNITIQENELTNAKFYSYEEAMNILQYENKKRILTMAHEYLIKKK